MTTPNILFIMLDDIGKEGWDLYPGYRSRTVRVERLDTPRMTALGEAGRVLDNFWVTPVCMPTRAAFATGALPHRSGYVMGTKPAGRAANCTPNTGTIFSAMKAAGYTVGAFGKWHLTYGIDACPTLPDVYGIDDYLITHMERANAERYWGADVIEKGVAPYRLPKASFGDNVIADRAASFLANAAEPFYCQYWPNLVHGPIDTTPLGGAPTELAKWLKMVTYADALVGTLLDTLAATGRDGNTLIFLTTDNGGKNAVVFGEKSRLTEDGICVPTLCYHPTMVAPGRESRLGQITDLVTTFSSIAGLPVTTTDGVDITALLTGAEGTPRTYCSSQAFPREWAIKRADGAKIAIPVACRSHPAACVPRYYRSRTDEERGRGRKRGELTAAEKAVYDELRAEARRLGLAGA